MTDPMDQPATKREIAVLLERIDTTASATKRELLEHMAATKRELLEHIATTAASLREGIVKELSDELARHTKSVGEDLRRSIGLVDDRYNDLPGRVTRLEAAVFKPAPLKRRRSR